MPTRIIAIGLLLLTGCDETFCKRRMEIVPGMTWEYYTPWHSRIISDKHGTIVEGEVFITFYELGFDLSGTGKCVYVDLIRNLLDDSEATHISLIGKKLNSFDAGCAMGMSEEKAHRDFLICMKALKERVERKLLQDGLRRL